MSDVFVEIREDEQQLEHPISLFWFWIACSLLQILHDRKRVCEQPFKALRINWAVLTAPIEGLVRSDECLVEKVVKAKSLARKRRRDQIGTRWPSADSESTGIHDTPNP